MTMTRVISVFSASDGDATKALYADLACTGTAGSVAVNLLRACKTSERAKKYRGGVPGKGSYRRMAYERKQWSMDNLCKILVAEAVKLNIAWGWGVDEVMRRTQSPHFHVLYVDLPTGQVSFHTERRGEGPDYPGKWDGERGSSVTRICQWAAQLLAGASAENAA